MKYYYFVPTFAEGNIGRMYAGKFKDIHAARKEWDAYKDEATNQFTMEKYTFYIVGGHHYELLESENHVPHLDDATLFREVK